MTATEAEVDGRKKWRVLVTRPSQDAVGLLAALGERGIDVVMQPMLAIRFADGPEPALEGVQALVFTSKNGVRAFARRSHRRDLPVFAVGDATASLARETGFLTVASAGGDIADLAALLGARCTPEEGALLHVAGSVIAGDLAQRLAETGLVLRREVLYEAVPATALDPAVLDALDGRTLDAALFFSPRSVATFASLVKAADRDTACASVEALCISVAAAEQARSLHWRRVTVAEAPTQAALLAALDRRMTERDSEATTPPSDSVPDLLVTGSAEAVIDRFGGIRPMAAKLGVPVTTVQGWKVRGRIPDNRHDTVREAAETHGVDLASAGPAEAPADPAAPEPGDAPPAVEPAAADASAPEAEPAPVAARQASRTPLHLYALGVAVLALLVAVTQPWWSSALFGQPPAPVAGPVGDPDAAERIQALTAEAASLAGRLKAAEDRIAVLARDAEEARKAVAAAPVEDAALARRIDELTARTEALAAQVETFDARLEKGIEGAGNVLLGLETDLGDIREGLRRLNTRVRTLEEKPVRTGEHVAALAVAAGQVETALHGGRPYRDALQRLELLARDDQQMEAALAPLARHADAGVAARSTLMARFEQMAPRLTEPRPAEAAPGWLPRLRDKLLTLVNLRRVGEEGHVSPVTRAERALAHGDLEAAVAALAAVEGPKAEWVADAEARLAAERALDAVQARVTDLLGEAARNADTARAGRPASP